MKGLTWRIGVTVASIVFAFYLLIPTYVRYKTGKPVPKNPKASDPWYYDYIPSETLKLGLDLSGGLHLVLGIDFEEVHRDAVIKVKNQLAESMTQEKIEGVTFETTPDDRIKATFTSKESWDKVEKFLATHFSQTVDPDGKTANTAHLKLTTFYVAEVDRRAVDQSLETLRNRIDEFGIAEPIITRQGDDKILVQFPGIQEPGRLKEIIARTAKLSFQVERSGPEEPGGTPSPAQLNTWVAQFVSEKKLVLEATNPIAKHTKELNLWLANKIPPGTEVLFQRKIDVNTKESTYIPFLLDREPIVTGEDLQDAYYSYNSDDNQPIVNFQLTPVGATKFETGTGANVGKFMAIVLDNNVHSAPRIKQKIGGGRAMIEMGGTGRSQDEIQKDAKDTSLVLRSGALPARLQFLEERVIGPSLGADAIRRGSLSLLAGIALVFVFLAIYYRSSGLFACFALAMNSLFILSAMAAFEGTLTLPGLAGITLTLGMAVDANVLIFEHMREELRAGKSLSLSIQEGYERAFSAIFDGNLTTIISGLVLMGFGYGPIRGFAVTLLIGLVASFFTAVFVTRVLFDWLVISKNRTSFGV